MHGPAGLPVPGRPGARPVGEVEGRQLSRGDQGVGQNSAAPSLLPGQGQPRLWRLRLHVLRALRVCEPGPRWAWGEGPAARGPGSVWARSGTLCRGFSLRRPSREPTREREPTAERHLPPGRLPSREEGARLCPSALVPLPQAPPSPGLRPRVRPGLGRGLARGPGLRPSVQARCQCSQDAPGLAALGPSPGGGWGEPLQRWDGQGRDGCHSPVALGHSVALPGPPGTVPGP